MRYNSSDGRGLVSGCGCTRCCADVVEALFASAKLWHVAEQTQIHGVKVIPMSLNRQSALLLSCAALLVSFASVLGACNLNIAAAVFLHF